MDWATGKQVMRIKSQRSKPREIGHF